MLANSAFVRPLQPRKALLPMIVTLLGMVIDVRPLQPEKAEYPMLVTLLGMVIDVRPLQPSKADSPMPNVPSSSVILVPVAIVPLYLYAIIPA